VPATARCCHEGHRAGDPVNSIRDRPSGTASPLHAGTPPSRTAALGPAEQPGEPAAARLPAAVVGQLMGFGTGAATLQPPRRSLVGRDDQPPSRTLRVSLTDRARFLSNSPGSMITQFVLAKIRPTFSSEKNSAGDVTPVLTRANPSIASWFPWIAPSSCWSSGGGGSKEAN